MRAVIIVLLCLLPLSCGSPERPVAPTVTPPLTELPKPLPKPASDDPLEQAKYDLVLLREKAAQAEARYEAMKRIAYDDSLRSQVMWITGIALLLAAVCGVAAFLVPLGKKTLVAAAVGCVVIAACAQAFREAVPYLPWIGGVAILAGGVWAAINWRRLGQTVVSSSDHGDRLEDWLRADLYPFLAPEHQKLFDTTVDAAKEESRKQAERTGTHAPLQYLRGKVPTLWQRLRAKVA